MSKSQLLSTKKVKDDEFKMKVVDNFRAIKVIYMNGDEIILPGLVYVIKDTIEDINANIHLHVNKVNISGIIINNCSYKDIKYQNKHTNYKNIATLLNEDYNENYIEVSLILGSYLPYIKDIIKYYNDDTLLCILDTQKKEAEISFISRLSILNNDCISSDDYDLINIYLIEKDIRDSVFLLNEIKKYLTIT